MKVQNAKLSRSLLILVPLAAIGLNSFPAMAAVRQINCSALPGVGSFSNPKRIGLVTTTTIVKGCPRLTSGAGFNSRYYSFQTSRTAPPGSAIGTIFTLSPTAMSAVHPRLSSGATTIARSLWDGFWVGQYPTIGRFLPISPLNRYNVPLPAGPWLMGVEKLDSPLRSLNTPNFDIVIYLPTQTSTNQPQRSTTSSSTDFNYHRTVLENMFDDQGRLNKLWQ